MPTAHLPFESEHVQKNHDIATSKLILWSGVMEQKHFLN